VRCRCRKGGHTRFRRLAEVANNEKRRCKGFARFHRARVRVNACACVCVLDRFRIPASSNFARSPAEAIVLRDKRFSRTSARSYCRGQQERETLGEDGSRRFRQRSLLDRQVYLRRPHEGAMEISVHRSSYFLFPRNRCANAFIGTDFFSLARSRVADIMRSISRQQLQQRFNDFNRSVERTRMGSGTLSDTPRTIDRARNLFGSFAKSSSRASRSYSFELKLHRYS